MSRSTTPVTRPAQQVFDDNFPALRAKLLEIAAIFDRIDRGEATPEADRRVEQVRAAIELLMEGSTSNRAEQMQKIFSLEFREAWREEFGLTSGR